MAEKVLMKGNEAIAEAAIRSGLKCYFGYPITPQNEIPAYMAAHLTKKGGTFIQAESEIAAINMVYGASCTGARAMTSSSSPGISLKQEGISYLVGAKLPAVIVNIMRGGPGLGNIAPSQADYFQSVKGGGHGDYRMIVYTPETVQEAADLTMKAFDKADEYRNPVLILGDAILGQMMEPLIFKEPSGRTFDKSSWKLGNRKDRPSHLINSLSLSEGVVEEWNWELKKKFDLMTEKEMMVEEYLTDDADLVFVAYGTSARICRAVVNQSRKEGYKTGLIRPITVWPFPSDVISKCTRKTKDFFVVEMSLGQMIEDVKLAVLGRASIHFHGRPGGGIPAEPDIMKQLKEIMKK
ncbi:MAG: 3-methyl-2-oxobutanoate dehydrogenase subunit VorB [Proteobacteria bacterium]|nr:3-methyl-2-oxobutanoate dehydrogenase subunit VorB [Pseudomonadota bacterium]